VLSWALRFPSRALSVHGSGFGLSRRTPCQPGLIPRLECSPEAQPSRVVRETRAPTPGVMIPRDPPVVRSYRVLDDHRQAAALQSSRVSARDDGQPPALPRSRVVELLACAPSRRRPTPPPSFSARSPRGIHAPGPRRRFLRQIRAGGPTCRQVCRLLWGSVPHRTDSKIEARENVGLYTLRPCGLRALHLGLDPPSPEGPVGPMHVLVYPTGSSELPHRPVPRVARPFRRPSSVTAPRSTFGIEDRPATGRSCLHPFG
jgi:hypothetical protein